MLPQPRFLPATRSEARDLRIDRFDIILISGDSYVDHPSFGTGLIGRVLWEAGHTVGVISQPDWTTASDFSRFGAPRLFFGVSSGNVDSMVNHFTADRKRRRTDPYSPGGVRKRPDRAAIVYADRLHAIFPTVPVVLGGIEASLRRFAHYDYWQDRVRQSILADAPADLLAFGMAEHQMTTIAGRLDAGEEISALRDIPGTTFRAGKDDIGRQNQAVEIPGYPEVANDKMAYAQAFMLHYCEQNPFCGRRVVQPHPKSVIIQNPPAMPLTQAELDRVYELPFSRRVHPSHREPVPALEPVRWSVTSHRGCFGGCSFCALTHHQGRIIQSRTPESILREVERMVRMPDFRGTIQDIGGPTANMYGMDCENWLKQGACKDKKCGSSGCHLSDGTDQQLKLLRRLREIPGVRHIFISSGVRFDLIPENAGYIEEICRHHIPGHLKVAPEHVVASVLELMGKQGNVAFSSFLSRFQALSGSIRPKKFLLPYFMSGHPGCTITDMITLAEFIRDHNLYTEQVQDFTPTPMSASTCMYFTGFNPFTLEPVHIPKGREKKVQRALLHYRSPANRGMVEEGLVTAGRTDLIGSSPRCLIPRRSYESEEETGSGGGGFTRSCDGSPRSGPPPHSRKGRSGQVSRR
jgi:uncharacterized radical SAM protein YgiQ